MRRLPWLLLLVALPASALEDGAWDASVWASTVFSDGVWAESAELVTVPDVVGSSLTDADTALESAGLDTGDVTMRCSAETADDVVNQNPAAGLDVASGTLVDLVASTGTACAGRRLAIGINKRTGL